MLSFLTALPLWGRILTWGVSAAALVAVTAGVYGAWHHKVYTEGYSAAINEIVAENERAIDVARQARARWRNCTATDAADGVWRWDQTTGQCVRGDL